MTVAGFSGVFERTLNRIPVSLASGMLAGVLLRFGLDVFVSMQTQLLMALTMFVTYLIGRLLFPRYAVIATLAVGIAIAAASGQLHLGDVRLQFAQPIFTVPALSLASVFGIALPLFIVTMTSQNVPGVAVIRASGYSVPISPVIGWTGVANVLFAPFGAFALNLAAITAAICMGREAHADPQRRYVAAVFAGVFYVIVGLFGATVASLLGAFPRELVMAIAGIALFGTIGNSLAAAMREETDREPALIAFLVTASGVSLAGIGSAFWGLLAGALTLLVWRRKHA
jgi:benzoate membrane transport protein